MAKRQKVDENQTQKTLTVRKKSNSKVGISKKNQTTKEISDETLNKETLDEETLNKETLDEETESLKYQNVSDNQIESSEDSDVSSDEMTNEQKEKEMTYTGFKSAETEIESFENNHKECFIELELPNNNSKLVQSINSHEIEEIYILRREIKKLDEKYKRKLLIILRMKIVEELNSEDDNFLKYLKILNSLMRSSTTLIFNKEFKKEIIDLRNILKKETIGFDKIIYLRKKVKERRRTLKAQAIEIEKK